MSRLNQLLVKIKHNIKEKQNGVLKGILLLLGGAIIIGSGLYLLAVPTDRVIFTVLVPGFVFGLVLIVLSMRIGLHKWNWFGG